ncbi:hypothetical protein SAMD00019534_116790, partial [Acytostelium subglobosum LB1]|uniref:hypothetical protein n=1 Tax=Acytostelium subglobosum LB1 TaxID=1410327 RepID=UPI0006451C94
EMNTDHQQNVDTNNNVATTKLMKDLMIDPNDYERIGKMKVEEYLDYQFQIQVNSLMDHLERRIQDVRDNAEKTKQQIRANHQQQQG